MVSSFESSGLSDEHDPMAIVSDNEVAHAPEVFTSDSESNPEMMSDDDDLDNFQPFALLDIGDDVPFVDDVEHPDDDLGNGEVFDIAILDVASPVVSVIDISFYSDLESDADSFESVTSSILRAAGLEAYPTDDDDVVSIAPATPVRVLTPAGTPPHTPIRATSGSSSQLPAPADHSSWLRSIRYASAFPHTLPTHGGEPSGHPHIPPPESSLCLQSPRLFPPYNMLLSDPYHPFYHSGYTRDDLLLSLQLQVEILCRRVYELESEANAKRPPPPDYPPPVTPPPPSSPPQVSPPPPPIHAPVDGHAARFLTLEQQVSFLIRQVHEIEDGVAHLRSLAFPTPPSSPAP
ncbi:hypothetical protein HanRHA438_Chr03g0114361 [Helianthus annuus]|nr:hypothetical protein HanIR_Chr03g0112851 [Helianthus annuus]KAJ0773416.1 hypothetical protein HanOQP8_Chr03g0099021 [Helianthus annuus]KAJ0935034.1 hypothetical protein HanRHA438_Chr03g0114361 [Helianthus annuus]